MWRSREPEEWHWNLCAPSRDSAHFHEADSWAHIIVDPLAVSFAPAGERAPMRRLVPRFPPRKICEMRVGPGSTRARQSVMEADRKARSPRVRAPEEIFLGGERSAAAAWIRGKGPS
ncbi:hypothetical protein PVAP13_9KG571801 [Panicum virgatum]|uniref:Uncharacterized protein n=1 Tax=Panicum virgatum TaxID=38727 RepID=A0A8T0NYJ6_PANVG|nr:hypothetical protein PVAP13_9KG571801 [Panicum virgatum]